MVPRGCVGKGHALSILVTVKFRCMVPNAAREMACRFRTDMVKFSMYVVNRGIGKGMPFPYGYGKISVHGPKRGTGNGVPFPYGHGKNFGIWYHAGV